MRRGIVSCFFVSHFCRVIFFDVHGIFAEFGNVK
jgi:hypothetical protein